MKKFTILNQSGIKSEIEAELMQKDPVQISFYTGNVLVAVVPVHSIQLVCESNKVTVD